MRLYELTKISELRRNPDQNPRISINDQIGRLLKSTTDRVADTPNLFVTFTRLDKVGINPTSHYNTPLGIYCYPAEYVMDVAGSQHSMSLVIPFAGDSRYATTFKVSGRVVNIESIDRSDLQTYTDRAWDLVGKFWKSGSVFSSKDEFIENTRQFVTDLRSRRWERLSPGEKLWAETRLISKAVGSESGKSGSLIWNWILRNIGIDALVDLGSGTIHENEPTQAVILNPAVISDRHRFFNTYSPEDIDASVTHGRTVMSGRASEDFQKYISGALPPESINDLPLNVVTAILSKNPTAYRFLRSEKISKTISNVVVRAIRGNYDRLPEIIPDIPYGQLDVPKAAGAISRYLADHSFDQWMKLVVGVVHVLKGNDDEWAAHKFCQLLSRQTPKPAIDRLVQLTPGWAKHFSSKGSTD